MELQEIPFELNRLYNLDSEKAIKRIPDKFFELAIIDPPYGIGENGTKNHTRSKLAESKDYKSYAGNDNASPPKNISGNYSEFQKIRLFSARITLSVKFRMIPVVGLYGTRKTEIMISPIVN